MQRVPHEALRHTIVLEPYEGGGALGPIFGDPVELRASVQEVNRLWIDGFGRQQTIEARVIIRPEKGPIKTDSRVTHNGRTYRVVRSYAYPDERRPTQWEFSLIRWTATPA